MSEYTSLMMSLQYAEGCRYLLYVYELCSLSAGCVFGSPYLSLVGLVPCIFKSLGGGGVVGAWGAKQRLQSKGDRMARDHLQSSQKK